MTPAHTELEELIERQPEEHRPALRAIHNAIGKMFGPKEEFDAACALAQHELNALPFLKSRAALGEKA